MVSLLGALLSGAAGFASFVFSLGAMLYITELNEKVVASIVAGAFCLLISYIASERPNSEGARALSALADRLIRRRYREPLYHTVLERYVQLITRNGVKEKVRSEVRLETGLRVRPDGTIVLPNGSETTLRQNQLATFNGNIIDAPAR